MSDAKPSHRHILKAGEWIARLEDKDATLADLKAFRRWIAASPRHRAAYESMSRTWDEMAILQRSPELMASAFDPIPPSPSRRALLVGGGGGLLALAGGAAVIALQTGQAVAYETGIGQQRVVSLGDGTRINLAARSSVDVHLGDGERRVRLIAGEALFEVAAGEHPFVIVTRFGVVEAEGGRVLVKLLPDGARATVYSGDMVVKDDAFFATDVRAGAETEIVWGDALSTAPASRALLERRVAWRDGRLAYDGESLAEAASDVSRETGARFEFEDTAIGDRAIGGLIDARDLDAFLLLVRENLNLEIVRGGDGLIVIRESASPV